MFRFRLQTLLELKKDEETRATELVAQKERDVRREQNKLRELEFAEVKTISRITETRARFLKVSEGGMALQNRADYTTGLQQELREKQNAIHIQNRLIETVQAALLTAKRCLTECSREVEILNKYREKQLSRYLREQARQEELQQDEIATASFLTRKQAV